MPYSLGSSQPAAEAMSAAGGSSDAAAKAAEVLSKFFDGVDVPQAQRRGEARSVCPAEDGDGEEMPKLEWNAYDRSLRQAMAERQKAQRERERQAEEEMRSKHQAAARKGGRVVGSVFIPREAYNLVNFKQSTLDQAFFWQMAHSWHSNFGLWGFDAEGEDPRVRVLVTHTVPAVMLMELNSVATFNMLDPVIGYDMGFMHDALNQCLLKRSPHSTGYPLGFVLQGAGPHFCPGGNHHPVSPNGATPFQMCTQTTSLHNARFREHCMPGITCITGSSVGGGVAIATLTTQRVCASNASMAFGNLSRGASPLMWLSKNLPNEVGMAAAISIYLADTTASAYACVKSGLAMSVAGNIGQAKSRCLSIVKSMTALPSARLIAHITCDFDITQYTQDSIAFLYNAQSGQMFANVGGKVKQKKKKTAAAETIAWSPVGTLADKPRESQMDADWPPQQKRQTQRERDCKAGASPRPFPDLIGTQPINVGSYDASCAQCGSRGMDGTIYGDTFYCQTCWPRMGLADGEDSATDEEMGIALPSRSRPRRTAKQGPGEQAPCTWCGAASSNGKWGQGAYAWNYYCSPCWNQWQGTPATGDISTDDPTDSGTDGTIFDSDGICFSDGSDSEWW
mmetsp:Transcript_39153/g.101228  ORF Transcript_39153/g.101228 Transcript_39153/m.101228 type:complete len:623 (-) Transcript_39153:54-1922(-)